MVADTPITNLDFFQIKSDLKDYLKSQTRFKDFNFEGANLSVLLDILAYNTYQNNFYTNMALNEMFIDSALLRETVISHAKSLNYIPRSRASAQATIRVTLTVADDPSFVVIPARTKFIAQCGSKTYSFYNDTSATITPVNGSYVCPALQIFEGTYIDETFVVSGDPNQRFVLSNINVDTSSIRVSVKPNRNSDVETSYNVKTSIMDSIATDNTVFIQGAEDEKYEIYFGKDVFGKQPVSGNVVKVSYRVCAGDDANGINAFAVSGNIAGYPATTFLVARSSGGAEKESIESIKYYAPKAVQIQDRAITESDYEILLKRNFPEVQAVSVFGGEEVEPPRYGKVIVAVDTKNQFGISNKDKLKYTNFLKERSPLGIEPIVISPDFMYFIISIDADYNLKTSTLSEADIADKIRKVVMSYSTSNLSDFRKTFRASRLSTAIDKADASILSNKLTVYASIPLDPKIGSNSRIAVRFGNKLTRGTVLKANDNLLRYRWAVKSTPFVSAGKNVFLQDDGNGAIHLLSMDGSSSFDYVKFNIGSIDYTTGRVVINNLNVSKIYGSGVFMYARVEDSDIRPPKNRIPAIRSADVTVNVIGVNP